MGNLLDFVTSTARGSRGSVRAAKQPKSTWPSLLKSWTCVADKSTASIPFAFTVATIVNCTLWTFYGTVINLDSYIWLPNTLGLASGLAQMVRPPLPPSVILRFPLVAVSL